MAEISEQEQQAIEVQSMPLRQYLMKNVMPTLTTGLVQLSKLRPEDPIDYLVIFLKPIMLVEINTHNFLLFKWIGRVFIFDSDEYKTMNSEEIHMI